MLHQIKTGLRRSGLVLTLLIPLAFMACDGTGKTKIRRGANATFNASQTKIILAETSYDTTDPDEPFFNPTKGSNFEVVLHELDANALQALGESPSQAAYLALLNSGREVIRFADEGQDGAIQYKRMYYFRNDTRILARMYENVLLIDALNGGKQTLKAPSERLSELLDTPEYPEMSSYLGPQQFAPSPDGNTIALWQSAAYTMNGDLFTLYFKNVISFFDADTGAHQGTYLVQLDDAQHSTINAQLDPVTDIPYQVYFLWNKTSDGVYVMNRDRAVSVSTGGVSTTVTEVPAASVPSTGGRIADDGRALYPYLEDSNETRMIIRDLGQAWTPFMDLGLIPHGTESYSRE